MKRQFWTVFVLALLVAYPAVSADFQKGLDAARKGDFPAALEEWQPLAKQGDAAAQYYLGVMHLNGQGVAKDDKEASRLFTLAAEGGNVHARFNLGSMYVRGRGVAKDEKEAIKWFQLAAVQGDVASQLNLGAMYENGQGVIKDDITSHMWWSIAATSGNEIAKTEMGKLERQMPPELIAEAKKRAQEWTEKHGKK